MGSPKSFYGVARDNGYFFIQVPKNDLSNYGAHTCNVTVSSSPLTTCPVDKSQTPVPIKFSEVLEVANAVITRRTQVAVQGFIACTASRTDDYDYGIRWLPGAIAKLECNNTRKPTSYYATANDKGYFNIEVPKTKLSSFAAHTCKVFLVSAPSTTTCNATTNVAGWPLQVEQVMQEPKTVVTLYNAGILLYDWI
ncbi:hypothetical protein QJS04_geneDACA025027 [Acorus gramineus]|uniref:Uncharacterized protein n=1 Tax=Acorus gramineus TaxID=55184 RepID=A0AAV9A0R3_ACOGR|nr:hypothetical protein QJS04_geneDACA025027 [Acorus gramineus]